jgi:hypothetical protein
MATVTDYDRLRRDVGASITVLSDVDAALLFVEAGEAYTDPASIAAATRVLFLRGLTASDAKMRDYTANNSQEKASQVFDHVFKLLEYWDGKLTAAVAVVAGAGGAARFGRTTVLPSRLKEWPGYD